MQSYIESFAQPTIGQEHDLGNGHKILVSARLLQKGDPYDIVRHIDPWEEERSILQPDAGMLLIEARDPTDLDEGTIAHCALCLDQRSIDLLEMEVAYPYRGNNIMEALIALSCKLTDLPFTDLSEDAFKYL